ncbi:erythromycin esterase family protein [Proteiniphilum sp. X52]|uniref:erythromycin esterase family protein n=1 Tax=Proteiniphilum sp. X52 TaxID=2382159 RepID=UPI000F0A80A4|nr:erythromycin esterase family protein [Proteiniphilum sp. X52]RNC63802.1 hypothetical protein D7D25_14445 [Proteiniphilum sp. X52]
MKKLFILLVLAYFIIFFHIDYARGQTYEDKYNLNFRIVNNIFHGWTFDANNSDIRFNTDTTDINKPIKFLQTERWGFREKMNLNMYSSKNILLPTLSDSLLKVKIFYKSNNIKSGKLFVYSLNKRMEISRTDSICLQNNDNFREDSLEMKSKDTRFLFFRLQVVGIDSTYTENKISKIKTTIPHEFSINRIELEIGRRNVNSLPFEDITALNLDNAKILTLPPDILLTEKQLSRIFGKITALGETVHGSEKIGWATTEIIKSSVLNNHTNLILFEQPLLMMLFFNKYIQGSDAIDDSLIEELAKMIIGEAEPIIELTKWLREYNKTAREKVNLGGMDCQYEKNELALFLKDYLRIINKEAHSSAVDSIISVLDISDVEKIKNMAKTTLHIIEKKRQELTCVLGKDMDFIAFYLNNLIEAEVTNKNSYYERDWRMFKNTSFFTDYLCKPNQTVVISCHFGHANYQNINIPFYKSFGYYMKKKYGNDYVCVAQTVYQDTVKAQVNKELERKMLPLPSSNSLEAVFSKSGVKYGYIDAKEMDEIVKLRMQGSHHISTSEMEKYINPRSQVQGVIFINQ